MQMPTSDLNLWGERLIAPDLAGRCGAKISATCGRDYRFIGRAAEDRPANRRTITPQMHPQDRVMILRGLAMLQQAPSKRASGSLSKSGGGRGYAGFFRAFRTPSNGVNHHFFV
jgi:hypothetical protein